MAQLTDALPLNTHLQALYCLGAGMSEAFARDRFLPAIRANTSLRKLEADPAAAGAPVDPTRGVLRQAEELVEARAAADAARDAAGAAALHM